ncbi:Mg2+ and Co2+ transporter [Vibrio nigripulchritudo ATCC 27043]|uniref:hypothetical protein n=1 Tax=Vibrio nigripulchritudo TaxID=28173 RepID=UPI00021C427E|nr:hypothetical protein [Vibrio nigripulchritudo]EGU52091.1 Mg2+ and Co2+ transporter [Vibrio nigripulchritudo ATCC 27043]
MSRRNTLSGQGTPLVKLAGTAFKNLTKLIIAAAILYFASLSFSKFGTIHGTELPESYFSDGYPSILVLLDSEFFMGLIFFVTLSIVIYVIYLLWQLHEVAVHKAKEMSSAHTQIVFALSLCGLFIDKAWWVLAIIIAFTRWDIVSDALSGIIRKGLQLSRQTKE